MISSLCPTTEMLKNNNVRKFGTDTPWVTTCNTFYWRGGKGEENEGKPKNKAKVMLS